MPLNKEPLTMSTSSLKPTNTNPINIQHSTPAPKGSISIDTSPIKPAVETTTTSEPPSSNESKCDNQDQSRTDEKPDTNQAKR